jgi:hypothetical protein
MKKKQQNGGENKPVARSASTAYNDGKGVYFR